MSARGTTTTTTTNYPKDATMTLYTIADSRAEHCFFAHLDLEDRAERGAALAAGCTISACVKCETDWLERYGHAPGCPDYDWGTMLCYTCAPVVGVERAVVGEGPVVEAHRDPTQTYELECGHGAI